MTDIIPCPFCNSVNISAYLCAPIGKILRCRQCDGLFAEKRNDEFVSYNQHHATSYSEKMQDNTALQTEYLKIFAASDVCGHNIARSVLNSLVRAGLSNGNILDVGCGSGKIGRIIDSEYKSFSWQGIELSPDLYNALDSQLQPRVIHAADLETALKSVPDHSCDAIILNHVLEHMAEPVRDLTMIKAKLKSDGLFFIEVPNEQWKKWLVGIRSFLNRGGDAWFPGHINFFTAPVLRRFLECHGFNIIKLRKMTVANYPDLFIFMVGGDQALAKSWRARAFMGLARLTRVETFLNYGIAVRVLCRPNAQQK